MGPKIHFLPMDKGFPAGDAESVLEVALRNGIDIGHSCGGMGSCTTCRVFVVGTSEPLPPRNEVESEMVEGRGFAANERLSCQLPPLAGLVVRVPDPVFDEPSDM
jgi:ferredoxin, 2Fe-2S